MQLGSARWFCIRVSRVNLVHLLFSLIGFIFLLFFLILGFLNFRVLLEELGQNWELILISKQYN